MCDQSPTIVWNSFDNVGSSNHMPFHGAAMLDDDFVPDWEDAGVEDDASEIEDWSGAALFGDVPHDPPGFSSMDVDVDEDSFFNGSSYAASSVAFIDDDRTLYSPNGASPSFSPASTITTAAPTPFGFNDALSLDSRPATVVVGNLPELSHLFPPYWQGNSLTTPSLGIEVADYQGLPLVADTAFPSRVVSREPSPFPIQLPYPSSVRRHPQASESGVPTVLEPTVSVNATHDYAAWGWGTISPT